MVTRVGDDIPERPVYRDPIGVTAYGGPYGSNYKFISPTGFSFELLFQTHSSAQSKPNGLTNEILLAILIDRLTILNNRIACRENERTLDCLKDALSFLEAKSIKHPILKISDEIKNPDISYAL